MAGVFELRPDSLAVVVVVIPVVPAGVLGGKSVMWLEKFGRRVVDGNEKIVA